MKKVLIITYYWPPSGGAGVQRWLKFAKYLPEFGWTPIIYTTENPESPATDESLLNDIPNALEVYKTPIWEPFDVYRKFTRRKTEEKFGAGFLSDSQSPKSREAFAIWVRGNLFIPDAKRFWIRPSVKYLSNYLTKNKVDLIISSGPPHTVHIIASKLKAKFNIPWIADFRDPWTEIDFYKTLNLSKFADKQHHRLEKKVLDRADLVISIGQKMASSFAKKSSTKQVVITNGYDHKDVPLKSAKKSEKFTIMHVGSINKDRNHEMLWSSLQQLISENNMFRNNIEIHFIGKLDHTVLSDIEKFGLHDFVKITSYIPHSEVIQNLQSAAVLYLPLNNTPNADGILTGKVFEYFVAKRPILAIGPVNGDLGTILKENNAGEIVDFNDEQGLRRVLKKMHQQFIENKLDIDSTGIEKYSRRNLTMKLVSEIEKIIHE